ncbi:MAG: hypothetical protein OXU61_07425 [Gammaproteobacteria bacterium]|nr:hypothetical protein [Gammaproteobacteria bacterium]
MREDSRIPPCFTVCPPLHPSPAGAISGDSARLPEAGELHCPPHRSLPRSWLP